MFLPFHDNNRIERMPVVTYGIIAINVLAFLWLSYAVPPAQQQSVVLQWGFIPARIAQLENGKPVLVPQRMLVRHPIFGRGVLERQVPLPPDRGAILLSLVTCMFLHGGWMHLIMNMWFLWLFGNNVEDRLGHVVFLGFYLLGGLLASAVHWLINFDSLAPVIGASGAVAAVLGAYAITWPWARVHTLVFIVIFITIVDVPAVFVLGLWFLLQLLEAQEQLSLHTSGGVAFWAHIGGFLAGLVLMPVLSSLLRVDEPKEPPVELVDDQPDES